MRPNIRKRATQYFIIASGYDYLVMVPSPSNAHIPKRAHLALDARERMAFAETYLSLLKGAEVTREHETVVLQSLMRPTQDGIIKDESGPDFALSSLLAKALERK